jgi:hypothetical protein
VRRNSSFKVHTRMISSLCPTALIAAFMRRPGTGGGEPHRLRPERRGGVPHTALAAMAPATGASWPEEGRDGVGIPEKVNPGVIDGMSCRDVSHGRVAPLPRGRSGSTRYTRRVAAALRSAGSRPGGDDPSRGVREESIVHQCQNESRIDQGNAEGRRPWRRQGHAAPCPQPSAPPTRKEKKNRSEGLCRPGDPPRQRQPLPLPPPVSPTGRGSARGFAREPQPLEGDQP